MFVNEHGRCYDYTVMSAHGTQSYIYNSPLGRYRLVTSRTGIVYLAPDESPAGAARQAMPPGNESPDKLIPEVCRQLDAYFAGRLRAFDVPLDLKGTTFQLSVWRALAAIPYGQTRSYAEIARAIGQPRAVRAVGQAIGANPVSIIVPCHRVIGSSGKLTGYAGGIRRKQALLNLEAQAREGSA